MIDSEFTTDIFLQKIAIYAASFIKQFAIGSGGHDVDGNVIAVNRDSDLLAHELLRADIVSSEPSGTSVVCKAVLSDEDIETIGVDNVMSEIALYDANDDLVYVKNFTPKAIESDEVYSFTVRINL